MGVLPKPILVASGYECETRIRNCVLPHLDFQLEIVAAHNKELLLSALANEKPAFCVSEFYVITSQAYYKLVTGEPDGWLWHGRFTAMGTGGTAITELFDEIKAPSPETRFVIASHCKGCNETKAHAEELKQHPEIIKILGFINGIVNERYLAKLFTMTYTGQKWHGTIGGKTE